MAKSKSESERWKDVLVINRSVLLLSQVVARRSPVSLSRAVEVVKKGGMLSNELTF